MITPVIRFSYANVFEPKETPSGDMKFSIACLLPKEDQAGLILLTNAIQAAIDEGLKKNTFAQGHIPHLRPTIRDGDIELNNDGVPKNPGFWFFNANSKNPPGIIDEHLKALTSPDEFYSGCWGRADVNFFPYNQSGNRGVGCGLNNLMKTKDDDRMDGRQTASTAFSSFAQAEQEEAGPEVPTGPNPFK